MSPNRHRIGLVLVAAVFSGCGGSIKGDNGLDGSTPTGACATLGACECMAAGDRCAARTEACWCPSECDPQIVCICGGGRFLGCEEKAELAGCTAALSAVQSKCPEHASLAADICATSADPACAAGCLAKLNATGSCAELSCRCTACDCVGPVPNPLLNCLAVCSGPVDD